MARTPIKLPSVTSDFLRAAKEAYAREKDVDTQLELFTKASHYRDKVDELRKGLEATQKAWKRFTQEQKELFLVACDPAEFHLRLFSSPLKTQPSEYGKTTDYSAVASDFTERLADALESLPFRLTKHKVKAIKGRAKNNLDKAFVRWLMLRIQETNDGVLPTYYDSPKEGECAPVAFVEELIRHMPEAADINPHTTVRDVLRELRGKK